MNIAAASSSTVVRRNGYKIAGRDWRIEMKKAIGFIAVTVALAFGGAAYASRPSMDECFEGSDFISNAALSRDAGMPANAFLDRMEEDFVLIRAFPNELRWFVHDADDESFLLREAREVFDHPSPAYDHRRAFLEACVERMAAPEPTEEKNKSVAGRDRSSALSRKFRR
jgi:hypothetical protein